MEQLRELSFDDLNAAVADAQQLLGSGYTPVGNWTLGQVCRHLTLVQDSSVDGYPAWMSLFAFLRPVMRRLLLPKVMSGDSPRGIRTMSSFVPPTDMDDTLEVAAFAASTQRVLKHPGPYAAHPAFGRLPNSQIVRIHTAHAAHHLRFLIPRA